jgi:uncharacterized protein (UPF0303 family)
MVDDLRWAGRTATTNRRRQSDVPACGILDAVTAPLPTFSVPELEQLSELSVGDMSTDAVDLGLAAIALIRERHLSLAVDVTLRGHSMFRAKLKSTGPGNDFWLDAKAAVATHFGEPSLLVKLRHLEAGTPFEDREDVDHSRLRAHGGSIPLRHGGEVVGTITVSGEPDVIDHEVAAEALRRYLRLGVRDQRLDGKKH